jgi:hypothetical protein
MGLQQVAHTSALQQQVQQLQERQPVEGRPLQPACPRDMQPVTGAQSWRQGSLADAVHPDTDELLMVVLLIA